MYLLMRCRLRQPRLYLGGAKVRPIPRRQFLCAFPWFLRHYIIETINEPFT
jgi:hypothetical protein